MASLLQALRAHGKLAIVLFVTYVATTLLARALVLSPSTLVPASAVAIVSLFFGGLELWPVIYSGALVVSLVSGAPLLFVLILPIAQAAQATLGAYVFRQMALDPLFRRSRDIFIVLCTLGIISLIVPTTSSIVNFVSHLWGLPTPNLLPWNIRYVGYVFSLIVLTPFLLRWCAKPKFSRSYTEFLETSAVFILLLGLCVYIFVFNIVSVAGIPLNYFLTVPLFWIALRLRPRFVTLAILVISVFAIGGLIYHMPYLSGPTLSATLFQVEVYLISLASVFFIIVSLEENRRLNANVMRSQLATLQNAMARISSESQAKNDFIAVLAHELRNPLAPVVTSIDVLKLNTKLDDDDREMLAIMEERMQTTKHLLDDLLDISRISEGKLSITKERLDLREILRRSILTTTHHLKERHQSLSSKMPETEVWVEGDRVRLEQVFSNLITNASKYSDSGDPITVSMTTQNDAVFIEIKDVGVGIPESAMEIIFMPFHQVELGARTKKGLGIGLALVRSIVELHSGAVSAESDGAGTGSTFIVQLPLAST